MKLHYAHLLIVFAWLGAGMLAEASRAAEAEASLELLEQQAVKQAVSRVENCIVQIRTVGGLQKVGKQLLSQGPTTGVILTTDGLIVSSAANFAGTPSSILVRLPTGQQVAAELVGRDTNRMLVLLRVKPPEPLPVPTAVPLEEVLPGQTAVALGRVFSDEQVNLSVGVISAKRRMHGRALQTDANVSPSNYGGALVDLQGRVYGVLVPMAPGMGGPQEADELAGVEYYDSGIAFAVPLTTIQENLERWVAAGDLQKGLLGIGMAQGSAHSTPALLTTIWPESPAATAGWKPGDEIVKVDGVEIATQSQLRFQVTPKYAGDKLRVTLSRGEETLETEVTLAAELATFKHAFLGVLPGLQDMPTADEEKGVKKEKGVLVKQVWPDSPAKAAGLLPGDLLTKLGKSSVTTVAAAHRVLDAHHPSDELAIEVLRDGSPESLTANLEELLGHLPEDLPAVVDEPESANTDGSPETQQLKLPEFPHIAWHYKPAGRQRQPLLIWLTEGDPEDGEKALRRWQSVAAAHNVRVLVTQPSDKRGWRSEDLAYLKALLAKATSRLRADRLRIAVAGAGKSGQVAYRIAFPLKKQISGVAALGVPLPRTLKLPKNAPGERLAALMIQTAGSPLETLIRRDLAKLQEAGYPAALATEPSAYGEDLATDRETRRTLLRWLQSLDRF